MSGNKQKWWERLESVTRNITASMDATDADVRELADMQEAFKSISKTHTRWLFQLSRRVAALEGRPSPPSENQSGSRDSAGQSADLRIRIAAALRGMTGDLTYEAMADAVIRELGLRQERVELLTRWVTEWARDDA